MNTQITGYQISYFVFSIFVSCLIVFTIHKGFQTQDIITIPIFAILLFLIIDFSAKSMYQNKMEKFFVEGFESKLQERFTKEALDMENVSTIREEEMTKQFPIMQEEMTKQFPIMQEEMMQEEMMRNIPVMQEEMMRNIPVMEEEMMRNIPVMEEEMMRNVPFMEEEMMRNVPDMQEEEELYQKYAPVENKPKLGKKDVSSKPSATPSGNKKAKEATSKQNERPDINKHLLDDGNNGLSNRNSETINPININVSYNNNRPFTVNDFNNPDIDKNTQHRMDSNGKITDINNYRFDDGCRSGVDNMNQNQNQKYFPAYLENPLNKNQPRVDNNSRSYEMRTMKRILNEQNDPSPVLLENPWSEWKPLDK